MRPLHLCFFKNFKIGKKHQRCWCAWVGLTDFSKFRKNKGARRQSCQRLSISTPDSSIEIRRGRETQKSAGNFLIHFVCSIRNMDRRDFFYPFYGQMPSTSYLQDLSQEPPFWPGLSPEQRTPESHLPLSYTRSSPASANISGESQQSPCSSNSDDSPDAVSASRTEQQGRKSYEKWSEEEKKLLVRLWADNFDSLESKDARKVWERIAGELSTKYGTKKNK